MKTCDSINLREELGHWQEHAKDLSHEIQALKSEMEGYIEYGNDEHADRVQQEIWAMEGELEIIMSEIDDLRAELDQQEAQNDDL